MQVAFLAGRAKSKVASAAREAAPSFTWKRIDHQRSTRAHVIQGGAGGTRLRHRSAARSDAGDNAPRVHISAIQVSRSGRSVPAECGPETKGLPWRP